MYGSCFKWYHQLQCRRIIKPIPTTALVMRCGVICPNRDDLPPAVPELRYGHTRLQTEDMSYETISKRTFKQTEPYRLSIYICRLSEKHLLIKIITSHIKSRSHSSVRIAGKQTPLGLISPYPTRTLMKGPNDI